MEPLRGVIQRCLRNSIGYPKIGNVASRVGWRIARRVEGTPIVRPAERLGRAAWGRARCAARQIAATNRIATMIPPIQSMTFVKVEKGSAGVSRKYSGNGLTTGLADSSCDGPTYNSWAAP